MWSPLKSAKGNIGLLRPSSASISPKSIQGKHMKKNKETKDLEAFLEANASNLVDANEGNKQVISAARADEKRRKDRAARLQKLRRDKLHLSQRELAKAVGANIRTLQSWERGR